MKLLALFNHTLPILMSITLICFASAVIHQRYELEVQNPGGFIGSNVIIKCNIPQFVKEYVKVTSWLEEPMHNIYPSQEGGETNLVDAQKKNLLGNFSKPFGYFFRMNYSSALVTVASC